MKQKNRIKKLEERKVYFVTSPKE